MSRERWAAATKPVSDKAFFQAITKVFDSSWQTKMKINNVFFLFIINKNGILPIQ